jgi:hypothetical protein
MAFLKIESVFFVRFYFSKCGSLMYLLSPW